MSSVAIVLVDRVVLLLVLSQRGLGPLRRFLNSRLVMLFSSSRHCFNPHSLYSLLVGCLFTHYPIASNKCPAALHQGDQGSLSARSFRGQACPSPSTWAYSAGRNLLIYFSPVEPKVRIPGSCVPVTWRLSPCRRRCSIAA